MTCPECEVEMEGETKRGEGIGHMPGYNQKEAYVHWGAEYFCSQCHRSWYYNKEVGLTLMGTNVGTSVDDIERYANMQTDDNGQVWD